MPYTDPERAKAHRKAYYAAHREEAIQRSAEWRKANPERYREHMRASYPRHKNDPGFLEKRREWTKAWREKSPEKLAEYRQRPEVVEKNRASALAFSHRYPEQSKASRDVRTAIARGQLVRPDTCGRCGGGGSIEAAHHDYFKPLEIEWLCQSCHRAWDRAEPKLARRESP